MSDHPILEDNLLFPILIEPLQLTTFDLGFIHHLTFLSEPHELLVVRILVEVEVVGVEVLVGLVVVPCDLGDVNSISTRVELAGLTSRFLGLVLSLGGLLRVLQGLLKLLELIIESTLFTSGLSRDLSTLVILTETLIFE